MNLLWSMAGSIYRLVNNIAAIAFAVMFILIIVQVIWRYGLSSPLAWPEEMARTCFLWLSYLGLVAVIRKKASYRLEYFVEKFPPALKLIAGLVSDLASLFFFVLILAGTWPVLSANWAVTTSISTPVNILYLSAPIAAFMIIPIILKSICDTLGAFHRDRSGGK